MKRKKGMSCIFISPKWEAKNTYFIMPARRVFGGIDLKFLVNSLGLSAVLLAGLTPNSFTNVRPAFFEELP